MAERAVRLPDVGEGVAEAELVEWLVKIGDHVREDQSLVIVMTDKASVEIPAPVAGEVLWLAAEPGESVAVGSDLVRLKVEGAGDAHEESPVRADAESPAGASREAPAEAFRETRAEASRETPPEASRPARTGAASAGAAPARPTATAARDAAASARAAIGAAAERAAG
ncbi:MAG: 2-oxo acid dehydrogenase subunit E2, partial [Burkholderiaceae bacterium]|nr:2-oxo acid dehydrogenase subunit E2 [Burkholderiaceae bacterium]